MQEKEIFRNLTIIPPIFIRIDGRSFHRLARILLLKKPFDDRFHAAMCAVCAAFLQESGLSPQFAYTFSDEINLYFRHLPFNGRVEKIDSVCASFAASALTLELEIEIPVSFDARIITVFPGDVVEYLHSRQGEAWRNHINAYCQQALIEEGMTPREAADTLYGMPTRDLHEMMFQRGVNLAKTPSWQRRGALVCKTTEKKMGFNPKTGEKVETERPRIRILSDLPLFTSPEGERLVRSLLATE